MGTRQPKSSLARAEACQLGGTGVFAAGCPRWVPVAAAVGTRTSKSRISSVIQIQQVPSKVTQLPEPSCPPRVPPCPCSGLAHTLVCSFSASCAGCSDSSAGGGQGSSSCPHGTPLLLSLHVGASSPPGVMLELIPRLLTQHGDRSRQGHWLGQGCWLVSPEEGERMPWSLSGQQQ